MPTPSIQTKPADPLTYHLPLSDDHTLRLRRLEAQIHILDAAIRALVELHDQPDQPEQRRTADMIRKLLDELHD